MSDNEHKIEYRVVRSKHEDGSETYSIQEVYLDGDGEPYAQTVDLTVEGPNLGSLGPMLGDMINCMKKPVLDEIEDARVSFPSSDDGIEGTWEEGQKYIYESPDGGQTIYRRKLNDDRKDLIG